MLDPKSQIKFCGISELKKKKGKKTNTTTVLTRRVAAYNLLILNIDNIIT